MATASCHVSQPYDICGITSDQTAFRGSQLLFSLSFLEMSTKRFEMDTAARSSFLARHKPSAVVLASQVSAAVVHGVVKALETGGAQPTVDPFQILLVRMLITGTGSSLYLWYRRVPGFPLGPHELRPILIARGIGGVLGAGGMYCKKLHLLIHCPVPGWQQYADDVSDSIMYLTLAQATALNFLAPIGAIILSKCLNNGNFTLVDPAGAVVALTGVIMVVQPEGLFGSGGTILPLALESDTFTKLKGMACGLVGVLGTTVCSSSQKNLASTYQLTYLNRADSLPLVFESGTNWECSMSIDSPDNDALHRKACPPIDNRQLLRLACRPGSHSASHHGEARMADQRRDLGLHGHRRRLWRLNGTSPT